MPEHPGLSVCGNYEAMSLCTLEAFADSIAAFLATRQITQLRVLAISFGATFYVALRKRAPHLHIEAAVLLDPFSLEPVASYAYRATCAVSMLHTYKLIMNEGCFTRWEAILSTIQWHMMQTMYPILCCGQVQSTTEFDPKLWDDGVHTMLCSSQDFTSTNYHMTMPFIQRNFTQLAVHTQLGGHCSWMDNHDICELLHRLLMKVP